MHKLIAQLLAEAPVITDGALGTQLQARGLPAGECPDAWNLTHPQYVEEVGRAYVEAGSGIILTNSFRANRIALSQYALADKLGEINRAAVAIARRAAHPRALVFGSIGPSGRLLMTGEVTAAELEAAFAEQAATLAAAGADGIVVETMSDLAEAHLAVAAAQPTGLPVVACMTFDSGKDKDRTAMGVTPEQAAAELAVAGADVIGANCGQGIEGYLLLAKRLRAVTDRPLWLKPNAGLPELNEGRTVYRATPAQFAQHARALVEAGASFLGGCCGTGPEFIKALATALSRR